MAQRRIKIEIDLRHPQTLQLIVDELQRATTALEMIRAGHPEPEGLAHAALSRIKTMPARATAMNERMAHAEGLADAMMECIGGRRAVGL